jgi:hypothetical protein
MLLPIERDWQGHPVPEAHRAQMQIARQHGKLVVAFEAPYFADPPPPCAAGSTPQLWEHEVIELFIADAREHYFELELGPHGHYLALELHGVRKLVREGMAVDYTVGVDRPAPGQGAAGAIGRYRGIAQVPVSYLPRDPARVNAYLIHGVSEARCYHAFSPVPGARPDFHRLDCFAPLEW